MSRRLIIPGAVSLILSFAAVLLAVHCSAVRSIRATERESLRIAAEEIVRRVNDSQLGVSEISALYDDDALAKARALSRMVANDPSVLADGARYAELARLLDVDEIHVSDAEGVLIASYPESYRGYAMNSSPQSREFMPAITNRAFELAQGPREKGFNGTISKYVGVARLDQPGIVQVGISLQRLQQLRRLADIQNIVRTSKVGRKGTVQVRPFVKGEPRHGRHYVFSQYYHRQSGMLINMVEADVGKYRVSVSSPVYGTRLADDRWYYAIIVVAVALFAYPVILIVWLLMARRIREIKTVFQELAHIGRGNGRRTVYRVLVACALVFMLGVMATWLSVTWILERRSYEMLRNGSAQFAGDFDQRIDDVLFFIGDAITRVYRTPYSFNREVIGELMRRHHVDEINVVNGDGIVTASSIGIEGDNQWRKEKPREFNEKLLREGRRVFGQSFRRSASEHSVVRKYVGVAFPEEKGYIQIGFDEKRMQNELDYVLGEIANGWNIGSRGYFILAKNSGEILSSGHVEDDDSDSPTGFPTLSGCGFDPTEGIEGVREARLYGEECICLPTSLGRYHQLLAVIPRSEIGLSRGSIVSFVGVILLAVLLLAGLVSSRMASLVAQLKSFIAKDKERRLLDMKMAQTIQSSSLPPILLDEKGYHLAAKMFTAREVGGDFYDFYVTPAGKLCFLVADVSGKGVPAAMFMMKAKAILKACIFSQESLAAAVASANDNLSENNEAEMFVTAWIGLYDPATGEVEYVSCGHNAAIIRRGDGAVEWVKKRPSLVLAALGGIKYRVERLTLGKGETIVLYTDGVVEAQNAAEEFYGEERLATVVGAAAESTVDAIKSAVDEFAGEAEQFDDITLLSLTRKE